MTFGVFDNNTVDDSPDALWILVPYIAIEIPRFIPLSPTVNACSISKARVFSTLIIKKFGPHRLLPFLVFSWGLVTTFTGAFLSAVGANPGTHTAHQVLWIAMRA